MAASSGLLVLGVARARRGILAGVAIAIGILTALGAVVAAIALGRHGGRAAVDVPAGAAIALAWGAGVLLAFASSVRGLARDRDEGITALVRARGASTALWIVARVAGLAVVVAAVVVGGVLVASLAAVSAASPSAMARVARASAGAMAYGAAFAIVIAPVAMAALGVRSRAGGYVWLLVLLVLPELFASWTRELLPSGWGELTSIPAMLGALRAGIASADFARAVRACAAIAVVVVAALAAVRAQAARLRAEQEST
jgi:hypothetical protein